MQNFRNLYEQIDINKRKSALLITTFIFFFIAIGYFISYLQGTWSYLVIAIAFSAFGSLGSYYFSDKISLSLANAKPASKSQYLQLHSVVENISQVANIPKPKVYLIPSNALNAFATGRSPDNAAIAITQGLLNTLDRTELEGVVAHEIAHITNYDTRLMTLVAILVGSIAILIDWSLRFGMLRDRNNNRKQNPIFLIIGLFLIILAPIIANLIKFSISRRREFFADAQGVKYTRQPSGLISALKKINQSQPLEYSSPATAHMYILNPLKNNRSGKWISNLFSTHPPVSERIQALQGKIA